MRLFKPKERIVAVIGYPGHGKTVFLTSLFWDSLFTLRDPFHDERQPYSVHAKTEEAGKVFYGNAKALNKKELPPPNPRKEPEPATLLFEGVPCVSRRWWQGSRQSILLTFYDIAGELVTSDDWLRRNASFLPNATDIIFLFDPVREDFNESMLLAGELRDRLYRVIVDGNPKKSEWRKKIEWERRHFIIALSKIDELRTQDDWWADVTDKRWPGYAPSPSTLSDYFHEMDELSSPDKLGHWLANKGQSAHEFIVGLPPNKHYCALSSLGHQPVWDCPQCSTPNLHTLQKCTQCHTVRGNASLRLTRKPEPFRVRDPLFWIFREAGVM